MLGGVRVSASDLACSIFLAESVDSGLDFRSVLGCDGDSFTAEFEGAIGDGGFDLSIDGR
jgi:hypothetical protein